MFEAPPQFSVVPIIQPGETIHSAVLRLGRLNGISDIKSLFKTVLPDKTNLSGVSAIFNQSPSDLIRKHTLTPLVNLFVTHEDPSSDPDSALQLRSHRLSRGDYTNLKFCPECMNEDLNTYGYSYWRRDHQMPGVHYCWEHKTRLRMTNASEYRLLPHEIARIDACEECPTPSCGELEERYNHLIKHILSVSTHLRKQQVIGSLRDRTKSLGYSSSTYSQLKSLLSISVYIDRKYGHDITLLATPIPGLALSSETVVRCMHSGGVMPQGAVLLAAALSESVDDALSLLTDATCRSRRQKNDIAEQAIRRAYALAKGVPTEISKILDIPLRRVHNLLQTRPYISLADKPCMNTLQALVAFSEGQPLQQACETHGARVEAVENLLRDGTRYASQKIQQILPSLA